MTDTAPIMVVAGEASGDLHGATLCRALRALAPERPLIGMGGPRMAAAGLQRLADVTASAVIGGTEAFGPLPTMWAAWRRLKTALAAPTRPAALVLIDFPEVNLRLAAAARRAGIPVAYFIPPQVWAWRPWRVRAIRRRVSLVLAVFPFETALYRRAGVPVEFVGHPALDAVAGAPSRSEARRRPAARHVGDGDAGGGAAGHADGGLLSVLAPDRGVGTAARSSAVDRPAEHRARPRRRSRALPAHVHGGTRRRRRAGAARIGRRAGGPASGLPRAERRPR